MEGSGCSLLYSFKWHKRGDVMLNFLTLSCCPLPQALPFLLETWKYPSNIWFREISVILLDNWTLAYSSVAQTVGKRCFTWSRDCSCRSLQRDGWVRLSTDEPALARVLYWGGKGFVKHSHAQSQRIFFLFWSFIHFPLATQTISFPLFDSCFTS